MTLNTALDVTYTVDKLAPHTSHRVRSVRRRAGGKGVNVASVLQRLGTEVLATGLCGGSAGIHFLADLHERGIPSAFLRTAGDTRQSIAVIDGDATVFNEPGPEVTPAEWAAFQDHFRELCAGADVAVLSGSLPPGLGGDAYAVLIAHAHAAGAATVLDASGAALRLGAAAGPSVVKPNAAELAGSGLDPRTVTGLLAVSRGAAGLTAVTPAGCWLARPPEVVEGNPTGAGDAAAAALALALASKTSWPDALSDAVALSASAVATPVAGEIDLPLYQRLRPHVIVRETPCPW
ncbi:1-phosphofructokinase family hexose kinase [Acrocarpospora catenulata]|uniref:1-phosphofructokinase family hexose kinase n=1 Tax=Acrocarpospora catenulata TaxID=2836182 RepID=UPI0027E00F7D|nr:PfkB family carbohydrate kinase [Acrocarpospora catenulata]